jgi:hypothetical protein
VVPGREVLEVAGSGYWFSGSGCWFSGSGCWFSGSGCWFSGSGCWFRIHTQLTFIDFMKTLHCFLLGAALMGCLITTAGAVILPPTDDTSGTLTYNTAKPPQVTKESLTTLNGSGTTLPVSKTRTAFVRFAVEEAGLTAENLGKARLTLYFPSVTKAGNLSLHVVNGYWEETFTGPTRIHPGMGVPFLTIPADAVIKK